MSRRRPWDWKIGALGAGLGALFVAVVLLAFGMTLTQAAISAGSGFTIAMTVSWFVDRKWGL